MLKSSKTCVCVDAGIVVRLVADPDDERIMALWDESQGKTLVAPSLIRYEVTNALHQYQRANKMSAEAAAQALEAAFSLPIDIVAESSLSEAALRLAVKYGLPATSDAHYLALAQKIAAEFWTTDRRLFNALQGKFPKIRLAGE